MYARNWRLGELQSLFQFCGEEKYPYFCLEGTPDFQP
jgi:hypothetical protein